MHYTEQETCPECANKMEVNRGYSTWCGKCNWNVYEDERGLGTDEGLNGMNGNADERPSDRLLEEFKYNVNRDLPFTKQRFYTYLVAITVHLSTLSILGIAIFFFSTNSTWLGIFGIALLLLWITIILPYRKRLPGRVISKDEYPELYGMIDEIGERLNVPPVDMVIISEEYNAYNLHLKRKKRALVIGIPFFAALTLQEKIAALSHQMSQFAHPNISNNSLVERARHVLNSWIDTVDPQDSGLLYWVVFPLIILRLLLFAIIGGVYSLLIKSMRNEMQRVFYIADNEASETAGSEAVLSLFLKSEMEGLFAHTAEQVAEYQYNKELYEEFRKRISIVPTQELLRIQRIQEMNDTQSRSYHPPMKNRIELIREHWAMIPAYRPDAAKERRINEEFRLLEHSSQKILLSDLRGI
ncbi:hypothetical protein [Paenibacillus xylanexedens]|uniref:M48 family metallopeptidase n=1 Tax=Paenibacillus xylanexedens TaxID=528191 RepID=UPI0028ED308D|nr:hypothetical protein [Paenibacillus xylanexedens]